MLAFLFVSVVLFATTSIYFAVYMEKKDFCRMSDLPENYTVVREYRKKYMSRIIAFWILYIVCWNEELQQLINSL